MEEYLKETNGTSLEGRVEVDYKDLVEIFGEPSGKTDGSKTDAEWNVMTPYGIATIYNYKDGKNYCGDNGLEVEDIKDWHIGGHNAETATFIENKVK